MDPRVLSAFDGMSTEEILQRLQKGNASEEEVVDAVLGGVCLAVKERVEGDSKLHTQMEAAKESERKAVEAMRVMCEERAAREAVYQSQLHEKALQKQAMELARRPEAVAEWW